MSSATRTSRSRLVATAAGVVLAGLSLTACNEDAGAAAARPAASASPTAAAPTGGVPTAAGTGSPAAKAAAPAAPVAPAAPAAPVAPTTTAPKPTAAVPAPKAPAADKVVTCEGSTTRTTAAPLNRPVNHLLLTVTNTGTSACYLYGYPAVRFGEAQAVPPVIAESRPQAVVTLRPGESGYASVNLSAADGGGSNGHTTTSLAVHFHGPSGNESVGAGAHPQLPAKGVHVDDSLRVTYWQQSMNDAVSW